MNNPQWLKECHYSIRRRRIIVSCTYSNTCVKRPLSKRPKSGFQDQLSLIAGQKIAMVSTFIRLPFVIKIFVLSILSGRLNHVLLYLEADSNIESRWNLKCKPILCHRGHIGLGTDPVGVSVHVTSFTCISSELVDGFWPNLHRYSVGRAERVDWILWHWPLFNAKLALWMINLWSKKGFHMLSLIERNKNFS